MKRIAALILTLMLALGLAVPALGESADPRAVFEAAAAQVPDARLEYVSFSGESAFGGSRILAFIARLTPSDGAEEPRWAAFLVLADGDGAAQPMGASFLPLTDGEGRPMAPDADYLAENVYGVLAKLPTGTAGSSLALAQAVASLLQTGVSFDFAGLADGEAETVFAEASGLLTEEERAAAEAVCETVCAELYAACTAETLPGVYEDAGVAEAVGALRADASVVRSALALCRLLGSPQGADE